MSSACGPRAIPYRPRPLVGAPRTVLYMDIDDTLLRYPNGRDEPPVPAAGAADFFAWAFEHFHVRWLTRWCRRGRMEGDLRASFCKMLEVDPVIVRRIRGMDWSDSGNKLDGILWLEHVVLDRPFLWIEDQYGLGERERAVLEAHGFGDAWIHCNVTEDPEALRFLHLRLRREGW